MRVNVEVDEDEPEEVGPYWLAVFCGLIGQNRQKHVESPDGKSASYPAKHGFYWSE